MSACFVFAGKFNDAVQAYGEKDWQKARRLFEAHVATHPGDAHAHFNIAVCSFQQGNYTDAIWNFEKAIKLDPSLAENHLLLDESYEKAGIPGGWNPPVSYFKLKLFQFSARNWAFGLLGMSLLTGCLLFIYFSRGKRKLVLSLMVLSFLAGCFCAYVLFEQKRFNSEACHAIVLQNHGNSLYLRKRERLA